MSPRTTALALALSLGCGAPAAPVETTPVVAVEEAPPLPEQLTCFSGTMANGICETFYANLEPLARVASHCRDSGGVASREDCPAEGRVGACQHDAHEDIYYGAATTPDQLRAACAAEGGVFAP